MTVCIAALCDGGKTCVVAADRMVVKGQGVLENKMENHQTKIRKLSSCSALLHSGYEQDAEAIIAAAKDSIAKDPSNVRHAITDGIDSVVKKYRDSEVVRALGPTFDFDALVATTVKSSAGPLFELWQRIQKVDLGELLLVSPKDEGFEIWYFWPTQGDAKYQYDAPYAAVGAGKVFAQTALTIQRYTTNELTVSEALFGVYSAKKAAELHPYVGEATDMAVLTKDGVSEIKVETLALLEKYRIERLRLSDEQRSALQQSIGL